MAVNYHYFSKFPFWFHIIFQVILTAIYPILFECMYFLLSSLYIDDTTYKKCYHARDSADIHHYPPTCDIFLCMLNNRIRTACIVLRRICELKNNMIRYTYIYKKLSVNLFFEKHTPDAWLVANAERPTAYADSNYTWRPRVYV